MSQVNIRYSIGRETKLHHVTSAPKSLGKPPRVHPYQGLITPPFRRLAAIGHEALNARKYAHIADLAEDIKRAAGQQRIPYDASAISAVLAYIGFRRCLTAERMSQGRNRETQ